MQPLDEAVSIMFVGMITVFLILFLIVLIGKVIISLSNKYLPDVVADATQESASNKHSIAAIHAAIGLVTKGKGIVKNIQKI